MQQNPGASDIFRRLWCNNLPGMKVSMGFIVSRQTAKQFTVNRQQCRLRLTVRKFQGVSNLTISADLDGIPAPKEFLN